MIQPNEAYQALKKETRPICDVVLKREKVEVSPVTQVLLPPQLQFSGGWVGQATDTVLMTPLGPGCGAGSLHVGAA